MKLKEKVRNFCILCVILLLLYSLCPTHDVQGGYFSRMRGFCAMPFYIIILFAFIIVFFYIS
jgi:hypothetical protein